jgi:hypothetical protein
VFKVRIQISHYLSFFSAENEQSSSHSYSIDDIANRVAYKRNIQDEILYEADVENFCLAVIYWSEGILSALRGRFRVEELNCK